MEKALGNAQKTRELRIGSLTRTWQWRENPGRYPKFPKMIMWDDSLVGTKKITDLVVTSMGKHLQRGQLSDPLWKQQTATSSKSDINTKGTKCAKTTHKRGNCELNRELLQFHVKTRNLGLPPSLFKKVYWTIGPQFSKMKCAVRMQDKDITSRYQRSTQNINMIFFGTNAKHAK